MYFDEKQNVTNTHEETAICIKNLLHNLVVVNASSYKVVTVEYFKLLGMGSIRFAKHN